MRMNRKGDIAISLIVLVLVAVGLVIMAFYNFISFTGNFDAPLKDADKVIASVNALDKYVYNSAELIMNESLSDKSLSGDIKDNFVSVALRHEMGIENTNLFDLIKGGKFEITESEGNYRLEIDNVFIRAENSQGSVVRKFDLVMFFSFEGERLVQ